VSKVDHPAMLLSWLGRRQVRILARATAVMTEDLNGFPQFFQTYSGYIAMNMSFHMISCLFLIKFSESLIESINKIQTSV
jgi:hypothetical protein